MEHGVLLRVEGATNALKRSELNVRRALKLLRLAVRKERKRQNLAALCEEVAEVFVGGGVAILALGEVLNEDRAVVGRLGEGVLAGLAVGHLLHNILGLVGAGAANLVEAGVGLKELLLQTADIVVSVAVVLHCLLWLSLLLLVV